VAYGDNPGKRVPVSRKTKKKPKPKFTLPKTHKPEATTRKGTAKAGPPSPQLTGRPTRKQPRREPVRDRGSADRKDYHKGDKHKQSQDYIDKLKVTRGERIQRNPKTRLRGGTILNRHVLSPREAVKKADATDRAWFDRVPDGEGKKPKTDFASLDRKIKAQATTLERKDLDPAVRRKIEAGMKKLQRNEPAKPKKQKGPKPVEDRPRSDSEMRKFLKDGKRPKKVFHPKPVAGNPLKDINAPADFINKQSTRVLHATAGGLRGKNVVKEFKKGSDTMSDVLKDAGASKGVAAAGGLFLDYYAGGGSVRFGVKKARQELEEKAARAARKGDTKKADRLREKAKRAPENRGVYVGVHGGIPFTSKRGTAKLGVQVTAKASKKTKVVPAAAKKVHDSKAGQAVGSTFMPRYRHPDLTHEQSDIVTEAKSQKRHKDAAADRSAKRRGQAYVTKRVSVKGTGGKAYRNERRLKKGESADAIKAAERATKEPITQVKRISRVTPEHKAVSAAKRKVRRLELRVQRHTGRTDIDVPQQSKRTVQETLRRVEQAEARRERKIRDELGGTREEAIANRVKPAAASPTPTLESLTNNLKPGKPSSVKPGQVSFSVESEYMKRRFRDGVSAGWGGEIPRSKVIVARDRKGRPVGALRMLLDDAGKATHVEVAVAEASRGRGIGTRLYAEAERRGYAVEAASGKHGLTEAGAALKHKRTEARLRTETPTGTNAAERHAGKVAAEYRAARAERIRASQELAKARKGERNAHIGAPKLYSNKERERKTDRVMGAEGRLDAAKVRLEAAEAELRRVGELHAGRAARGIPSSKLAMHDRKSTRHVGNLEKSKGELQAAKAEKAAAEEKAKGVKRNQVILAIPTKKGEPDVSVKEAIERADRYSVEDFPPHIQEVARTIRRELDELHELQAAAGIPLSKLPDYVPHMEPKPEEIGRVSKMLGKKATPSRPQHAKHRTDPRSIDSQNLQWTQAGKEGEKFATDLQHVMSTYIARAKKAVNDADYLREIRRAGEPVKDMRQVRGLNKDTHSVYEVNPTAADKGPAIRALEDQRQELSLDEVEAVLKKGGDHNLVILPKAIGDAEMADRFPKGRGRAVRALASFGQGWDRMTSAWKTMVTTYNAPFYQERNFYDDSLRAWFADTDATSFAQAMKLVPQHRRWEIREGHELNPKDVQGAIKIGKVNVPRQQFLREAEEDGILRSGHFGGELAETALDAQGKGTVFKGLREAGAFGEDIPRVATYLAARRRGMTRKQARTHVRVYHFDYTELTDAERAIRRLIPFYTFTSRNTALQVKTLFQKPGKTMMVQAFREEMAKLADVPPDWDKDLTEVQRRALPVPIRSGDEVKAIYMGLSPTDLNRLPIDAIPELTKGKFPAEASRRQFDLFMQITHPLPKFGVEMGGNHSFFFRSAIYPDADNKTQPFYRPAPGWVKSLPEGVRKSLDIRLNYPDVKSGQKIPAWPSWLDYTVRNIGPQFGLVANLNLPTSVENSRGQTTQDRVQTWLTGFRVASIDSAKAEAERLRNAIADDDLWLEKRRELLEADDPRSVPEYRVMTKEYERRLDQRNARQKRLDEVTKKVEKAPLERQPKTRLEEFRERRERQRGTSRLEEFRRKRARERAKRQFLRQP
jgi:ribosomal protein S18 acetylase RimI-like enzyme